MFIMRLRKEPGAGEVDQVDNDHSFLGFYHEGMQRNEVAAGGRYGVKGSF